MEVSESNDQTSPSLNLTSTTAPGQFFHDRAALAQHYQSDYHKYNLKRRQAGLPLLLKGNFEARVAAAKAVQEEKERLKQQHGVAHLKDKSKQKKAKKKQQQQQQTTAAIPATAAAKNGVVSDQSSSLPSEASEAEAVDPMQDVGSAEEDPQHHEEDVEIDPCLSLFDSHVSNTVEANIDYMQRQFGFFVPDREFLVDAEGLIGYCHEKIKLGHMCLYCHSVFTTWKGCQQHMMSKQHTKLRYEEGIDLEDLSVFYDFRPANAEYLENGTTGAVDKEAQASGDDDDDWEDISEGEAMDLEDESGDDDVSYDDYKAVTRTMGLDITPLGELVFPDGRIVGHRALRRYYKQQNHHQNRAAGGSSNAQTAVMAARSAAGERLIRGQVYSTSTALMDKNHPSAQVFARAGIAPGLAAGRAGKGILVPVSRPGGGDSSSYFSFSQLSVYRFRAVLRKQRRDEAATRRGLHEKTRLNMNRMDKKANRLHNNVSVAHAPR